MRIRRAAIAALAALVVFLPARRARTAEAPSPEDRLRCKDEENQIELRVPAPYWEMQRPDEVQKKATPGGCGAPSGTPRGMLLHMRNKDARAEAALRKMPHEFLVRNKGGLEKYARDLEGIFKSGGGEPAQVPGKPFEAKEDGKMFVHRFGFVAGASPGAAGCAPGGAAAPPGPKMECLVVNYFVRPAGGDVRQFMLFCAAPQDVFERHLSDFVAISESFRFTGQPAAQFFEPNAPEETLPSAERYRGQAGLCGSPGLIMAVLVVLLIYWFFRRRAKPRGVMEP